MKSFDTQRWTRKCWSILVLTLGAVLTQSGVAQAPHLTVPVPGGMPGLPLMTDIQSVGSNHVELQWDGPSGIYGLMRKLDIADSQWEAVGPWSANRAAVVPASRGQEFFSVIGPSPDYAGSATCAGCHQDVHQSEADTHHAAALETLKAIGQGNNPSCLPCHTVGYDLPTGFTTEAATPYLAGVQCENCHGPAAPHAAEPYNSIVKPRVEMAGQMCGGCHTGSHHPTYDEWSTSGHAVVLEALQEDFEGPRGAFYIPSCGGCHSGSVRQAYLAGDPLPGGHEAGAIGIVCATCHDPHQQYVRTNVISGLLTTNQLRNPTASFEDYHTSGDWETNYNPNVNVCAQCHNDRGASWTSTSRPPHHSPQYNMLLSTVGELPAGMTPWSATHAGSRFVTNDLQQVIAVTNQCVTCHMQTEEHQDGPPEVAANTGHTFGVDSYRACLGCHQPLVDPDRGEELVAGLVDFVSMVVDLEIEYTKTRLDQWATTKAPEEWRTTYGTGAWEYATPGDLSPGSSSPTSTEQEALLQQQEEARMNDPNNPNLPDFRQIQKARFNLYLVNYDGSLGVHNTFYSLDLLTYAQALVQEEMDAHED